MLALLFSLFLSPAAPAQTVPLSQLFAQLESGTPACFGREYSTEQLEANRGQSVRKIRAKLLRDESSGFLSDLLELELSLKGEKNFHKVYRAYLPCETESGTCTVECDGGSMKVAGTGDGQLLLENEGIVIDGGCGEGKARLLKPARGGDELFRLQRLPAEYCQL
jgi:hypothetical protein